MNVREQCMTMQGSWVHFRTPWGYHRGIVQQVEHQGVLVKMPRNYVPAHLANANSSAETKVELALQQVAWGNPNYGYGGGYHYGQPGYGAGAGYGPYRPGYGWWNGGWLFWWLAFAWIFALAFLW